MWLSLPHPLPEKVVQEPPGGLTRSQGVVLPRTQFNSLGNTPNAGATPPTNASAGITQYAEANRYCSCSPPHASHTTLHIKDWLRIPPKTNKNDRGAPEKTQGKAPETRGAPEKTQGTAPEKCKCHRQNVGRNDNLNL